MLRSSVYLCLFLAGCSATNVAVVPVPSTGPAASSPDLGEASSPEFIIQHTKLVQLFEGAPDQCGGGAYNERRVSKADAWSDAVVIDTDDRGGSCQQSLGLISDLPLSAALTVKVEFLGTGDASQCRNSGTFSIPVTVDRTVNPAAAKLSGPMIMDMDSRSGGCQQTYSVEGVNDIGFVVDLEATNSLGADQCGNRGERIASTGNPVTIMLDTDGRTGGCSLRYKFVALRPKN